MSFGAGWFFLTAAEAITVNKRSYALPGIGSYVASASRHVRARQGAPGDRGDDRHGPRGELPVLATAGRVVGTLPQRAHGGDRPAQERHAGRAAALARSPCAGATAASRDAVAGPQHPRLRHRGPAARREPVAPPYRRHLLRARGRRSRRRGGLGRARLRVPHHRARRVPACVLARCHYLRTGHHRRCRLDADLGARRCQDRALAATRALRATCRAGPGVVPRQLPVPVRRGVLRGCLDQLECRGHRAHGPRCAVVHPVQHHRGGDVDPFGPARGDGQLRRARLATVAEPDPPRNLPVLRDRRDHCRRVGRGTRRSSPRSSSTGVTRCSPQDSVPTSRSPPPRATSPRSSPASSS